MREIMTKQKKETSMKRNNLIKKFFLYLILLIITAAMLIPFIWMLSASIKTDREVFQVTPFVLIPETPRWSNYVDIWTKIPFGTFVKNTVFLTIVVTALQLLTSSFAGNTLLQNWSSSIRMHCSWHTLRPSLCRGRYTWFRSLS